MNQLAIKFFGETFDPAKDAKRLGRQLQAVRECFYRHNGEWMTLRYIAGETKCPEASVSARYRQLRSMGEPMERRRVSDSGLFEYRVSK